jgi:hypothetical protein
LFQINFITVIKFRVKSKSVKNWEEINLNKRKNISKEKNMENIEKEEKIEVKEEKINEEQKPEVNKQCTSLYNKYKRKREGDEDTGDYKIYKKRSVPGYFQYTCEVLANDEKSLYEIFKEYPSIFTVLGKNSISAGQTQEKEKTGARSYLDFWSFRCRRDRIGRQIYRLIRYYV